MLWGSAWLPPLLRIAAGDSVSEQLGELKRVLFIPLIGIAIFLVGWSVLAPRVETSLGALPGPAAVWEQAQTCGPTTAPSAPRKRTFYERQKTRNAARLPKIRQARRGRSAQATPASRPTSTRSSPA